MDFSKIVCCGLLAVLLISQESRSQQIFCGEALRKILDEICDKGFQQLLPSTIKRSVAYRDTDIDNDILPLSYSSLFVDPMFGKYLNAMAQTRRRRYGSHNVGVVDSCCYRGCTYDELAMYCK